MRVRGESARRRPIGLRRKTRQNGKFLYHTSKNLQKRKVFIVYC